MSGACAGVVSGSVWPVALQRRAARSHRWRQQGGLPTSKAAAIHYSRLALPCHALPCPARSHAETRHHHLERAKDERMDRRDGSGRG